MTEESPKPFFSDSSNLFKAVLLLVPVILLAFFISVFNSSAAKDRLPLPPYSTSPYLQCVEQQLHLALSEQFQEEYKGDFYTLAENYPQKLNEIVNATFIKCSPSLDESNQQANSDNQPPVSTELKILLRRMQTIRREISIKKAKSSGKRKAAKRENEALRKLKMYNFLLWANEDIFAGSDNQLKELIELIKKQQTYYQKQNQLDPELTLAVDKSFQSLGVQLRSCLSPRSRYSKITHSSNPIINFFISIIDRIFRMI
ncbi:uncharacterized protein TRIADDRAFT_61881 [Trichoplax adhaerens]|uniref:Uncharacterized protein n=1 Tax=Trichoplax adhaerens TaxID=10228 RepID=B3SC49_TRIAD|nr:predicted protein [Trichoplax adhaerens]EDV19697.1 predicted protein [Trichoplax adhaerens]|eukprot:XP_002117854.1 predicted protein [Trichoplax adhaerens]